MKTNVTQVMVDEHKLILRMIALVEKNIELLEQGKFMDVMKNISLNSIFHCIPCL